MTHFPSDDIVIDAIADPDFPFDLGKTALLLDIDGTLIDIGPTPRQVHVPRDLKDSLARLNDLASGALALVSGRPIADIDNLFAPLRLSSVGVHGAEMRIDGVTIERGVEPLPADLRRRLRVAEGSGVIVEDKGYSLALHFRNAPARETELQDFAALAVRECSDDSIELLRGKSLIEIRRGHVHKGEGVQTLMRHAPFKGRAPVFIGDDVTDEDVFAVLPALGGVGYSVSRKFAGAARMFHSPADVRAALARLAQSGGRPQR